MPTGLVRSGDFRKGTPITLPHTFGTPATLPEPQGNVDPQANSSLSSNPVTWAPSPVHFGNTVDLSLQVVAPIVVVAPSGIGTTNINLTQLLGTPTPTLTYSGAPAGVTLAFAPNPDTGTSVCTVTVSSSVPAGKYMVTIVGTTGAEINTTNIHIVVTGINATPAAPTFNPSAGTYAGTQTVIITGPAGTTNIYFTLDGTTPTTSSQLYNSGGVEIASSETLQAIAVVGGVDSAVGTAAYTITASSQAASFFARLATQPSAGQATIYNNFISGLVNAGVWNELDALYMFAAYDSPTALTNVVATGSSVLHGNPTFSQWGGFTAAANTDYINTQITPSTAGGNYAQNSASMFGWRNIAGTAGNIIFLGTTTGSNIQATVGGNISNHINSASLSTSLAIPFPTGLFAEDRTGSAVSQGYLNGVPIGAVSSAASAAIASGTFVGLNEQGQAFAMTGQEAMLGFGGALTDVGHRNLYFYSNIYLAAVAGGSTIGLPSYSNDIATGNATGISYGTGIARLADGRLIAVYSVGTALNTASVLYYQLSSNSGVTWGAPVTLETPAATYTYTEANVMVTPSGVIVVNASYYKSGSFSGVVILGTVATPLGSITWASPYTIPSALADPISDGQAVYLQNGNLMIPMYNDTGSPSGSEVTVLFSANEGTTFGNETVVVTTAVTGNNDQWGESGFVVLPNGTVYGVIRNSNSVTTSRMGWWYVTSSNNGATWSSPAQINTNAAVSRPALAVDQNGNMLCVGRFNVTSPTSETSQTAYMQSTDGAGAVWTGGTVGIYTISSSNTGYGAHGYAGGFWDTVTQTFMFSIIGLNGYTLFQQFLPL